MTKYLIKVFFLGLVLVATLFTTSGYSEIVTFNDVGYPPGYHNPIYQPGYLLPVYNPETGTYENTLYLPGYSDGILNTDGFTFTGDHFHTIDRPYAQPFGGSPDNGTIYVLLDSHEQGMGWNITLTSSEGRPFSLFKFDGAESFLDEDAAAAGGRLIASWILVEGTTSEGTVLTASFPLDGVSGVIGHPDFETFFLPGDWNDLVSVTFSGFASESERGGFSLDNIEVAYGQPDEISFLTLEISPAGKGTTFPAPGDHAYSDGAVASIIATAKPGYMFSHWSGDVGDVPDISSPNITVTMTGDRNMTANFEQVALTPIPTFISLIPESLTTMMGAPVDFALTVGDGDGYGDLTQVRFVIKEGIGCATSSDAIVLEYNSRYPNSIWLWSHSESRWKIATVGTSVILEDTNCFLDASRSTISGDGGLLAFNFNIVPKSAFIAAPLTGHKRIWLQLRDKAGHLVRDLEIGEWTVSQGALWTLALDVDPAGAGTTSPAAGTTYTYGEGVDVTLSATANRGYRFANWTGDVADVPDVSLSTITVTMAGDRTITASFAPVPSYTLTMTDVSPTGAGTTSPSSGASYSYFEGENITLSAVAGTGYRFLNWSGDVTDVPNPSLPTITIIMDADRIITANFEATDLPPEPVFISLIPDDQVSSVGAPVDLTLTVGDGDGWQDIKDIRFVIKEGTGTGTSSDAVVLWYTATYPTRIWMWSHAQNRWINAVFGSTVTLEDTNCFLDVSKSSMSGDGDVLTMNFNIIPKPAFVASPLTGHKRIWLQLKDGAGNMLRNAEIGSWVVTP